jgi:acyl transferase domain-containing protein
MYGPTLLPAQFGVFVAGVDAFDAAAFGVGAPEAALMDPQQRLLLRAAAEAALPAGLVGDGSAGSNVGAYVGISSMDYNKAQLRAVGANSGVGVNGGGGVTAYTSTGASLSVAAGRLAFVFNWRGPALAVDTACSSSLVAAHGACAALRGGECAAAAAGGANVMLSPDTPAAFQKAGMLSPEGRCKTLDASADGYVRAEAVGVLMLQLLLQAGAAPGGGGGTATAAVRALAVVAGSAVNSDGRSSVLTAPNGPSQAAAMRAALAAASMAAAEVRLFVCVCVCVRAERCSFRTPRLAGRRRYQNQQN